MTDTLEKSFFVDAPSPLDIGDNVDWDDVDVVQIDDVPYHDAFDTDTFYRIPTTVTREMAQPYVKGGKLVTMKKPADELRKAAWSLDNRPVTLGHPEPRGSSVKSHDEIHGFVRDPEFDEDDAIQRANTYVPTTDDRAIEFVEDGGDNVSPGFHPTLVNADEDDIDAYQTDIVYDHVALTKKGRCTREDGCGLAADSVHGHVVNFELSEVELDQPDGIYVADVSDSSDESDTSSSSSTKTNDGQWFAVAPDEHTKDSTEHPDDAMYEVDTCADVEDAWRLRNSGEDLTISLDTLHARIQRAGEAKGCNLDTDSIDTSKSMTDCDCNTGDKSKDNPLIEVDSLSLDAVAEKHDGVANVINERDELESEIDSLESDIDEKEEQLEATKTTVDDLKEDLSEYEDEEKQVLVDDITDLTEVWDEEDLEDLEIDTLEERLELAQDMATDVKDVSESGGSSNDETPTNDVEYEPGQTYDMSGTA